MQVIYAKYNNYRKPIFRLSTTIIKNNSGIKYVEKKALSNFAIPHIQNMQSYAQRLTQFYDIDEMCMPFAGESQKTDCIRFPFCQGVSLEQLLLNALHEKDMRLFYQYVDVWKGFIDKSPKHLIASYHVSSLPFAKEMDFVISNCECFQFVNIDMIPSNLFFDNKKMIMFDYEWCFDNVPVQSVYFRSIFVFAVTNQLPDTLVKDIYTYFGVSLDQLDLFKHLDAAFSNYVETYPLNRLPSIPLEISKPLGMLHFSQLFYDTGKDFSEEESIKLNISERNNQYIFDLSHVENIKNLRFDPANFPCKVKLGEIKLVLDNGESHVLPVTFTNSDLQADGKYMYFHDDPILFFDFPHLDNEKIRQCVVDMQVEAISEVERYDYVRRLKSESLQLRNSLQALADTVLEKESGIAHLQNVLLEREASVADLLARYENRKLLGIVTDRLIKKLKQIKNI